MGFEYQRKEKSKKVFFFVERHLLWDYYCSSHKEIYIFKLHLTMIYANFLQAFPTKQASS